MGINLGDPVFRGIYHEKQAHEDDLDDVVQRAVDAGCVKMMVTGSDLKESTHAVDVAKRYRKPWTVQAACKASELCSLLLIHS